MNGHRPEHTDNASPFNHHCNIYEVKKKFSQFQHNKIFATQKKQEGKSEKLMTALMSLPQIIVLVFNLAIVVTGAQEYSRSDFPPDFVFGSGTSSYQVEGAAYEDGRTPSIFDTYVHDGSWHYGNGDVAVDGYHKYKEDVQLMVDTQLEAYRFSISWSRLIPYGRGPINPKGLQFYNNLINELIKNGVQPHVTLLHVDLPQALEDEYGGFLDRRIIEDFTAYADVCFREFGDRVLHWSTVNEGNIFIMGGYDQGFTPPKRCSWPFGFNCTEGNSTTEPYLAAHNMLLAHASIATLYRKKYQVKQHGFIGMNLFAWFPIPATNRTEDLAAAQRANDFFIGWFMNPLMYGDYPEVMKKAAGKRIPAFTKQESEIVKGSFDFVGLNHYTSIYVKNNPDSLKSELRDYIADAAVAITLDDNEIPSGEFPVMPWGLQGVLENFKNFYDNPPVYIHENGQMTVRNETLNDTKRVDYHASYIGSLLDAVRNGSNARGYFTWSFIDVFELLNGWETSFGLYYVDLDDPNMTRYPKLSQHWYSGFLKGKLVNLKDVEQERQLPPFPLMHILARSFSNGALADL